MHSRTLESPSRMVDDEGAVVRWWRGLRALRRLQKNPDDTEQVFEAGVNLSKGAFPRILARFAADPEGQRLLKERPSIDSTSVDLGTLAELAVGTLGREYSDFLRARGLHPDIFQ